MEARQVGSFIVGACTVGAIFFAYDQYRSSHAPEEKAQMNMSRVLSGVDGKDYCAVYSDGTVERTRYGRDLLGRWSMAFWRVDGDPEASPIKGYTSRLTDLEPDRSQEFSATYIVEHKNYREGLYPIDGNGIFTYRTCSQPGRCTGVESYPCDNMDYPGVKRIVAAAPIDG